MENNYLNVSGNALSFSSLNPPFMVSYKGLDGVILHGYVTQVTPSDFEVFIKEKEVIIQCKKDENGNLSCSLNSKRNLSWVDGISKAVARMLIEQ